MEHTATVLKSFALEGLAQGTAMALGEDAAWLRLADGSVARVNRADGAFVTIPVGTGEFGSLAIGEGAVWVTTFDEDKLSRIDPATNTVVAEIEVGTNPEGIAVTPGAVWVSNHRGGSIWRIDPATNAVVARIDAGQPGPSGPKDLQLAFGDIWTTVPNSSIVIRVDPETNEVATIDVVTVEALVVGDQSLYVTDALAKISEIDPESNTAIRRFYPDAVPWIFGDGSFWSVDGSDLLRLDTASFATTETWHIPGEQNDYFGFSFVGDSIWLLTNVGLLLEVQLSS
ncbi:MAG TPA: YncE family protein [Methylomirabilota bacterium]|nr:YncE family protein [Methylomirabilota bacterium]